MSRVAQKSDLSNPQVIYRLCPPGRQRAQPHPVPADGCRHPRGTSPKVWNAWKGKNCWKTCTHDQPRSGTCPRRTPRSRPANAKPWCWWPHALPFEAHKPLWNTLDVGYFMRHDAADIAWHTRKLAPGRIKHPSGVARRSPIGEGLQVLVTP